jgi:phosphoribosylaminoimidazole-succinocarboxamide synthase
MREALMTTNLPLPNRRAGKVRDLYDVRLPTGEPGVLIVASDRISAFDVVMANGLPGKGIVLTQLSKFWFEYFSGTVKHHLVSTDPADIPGLRDAERRSLAGRVMLCRKVDVVPIECIARGYITGSGWKDYQKTGSVCGIPLPKGLRNGDRLEKPLFTPSTKAASGHDENISFDEGVAVVGAELMRWLGDTTLDLYTRASAYALQRGIILADTKFEFGQIAGDGTPLLVDEIFTPDSSRFWPADQWRPGAEQPSFDKQYVRDYLETLVSARRWDKTPPGPPLPQEVVQNSLSRYREAFERLTGAPIDLDRF